MRSLPVLIGSMTLLGLVLVFGSGAVEVAALRSRGEVDSMLDNALPSTDDLTQVAEALGRIDSILDRDMILLAQHLPIEWGEVAAPRAHLSTALERYRARPPYRGERLLQAELQVAITQMDMVLAGLQTAIGQGNLSLAQNLDNGAWRNASDGVDGQVRRLLLFNVEHATAHAHSLDALWRRVTLLTAALALLLLVLGTAATWMAVTSVGRHLHFEEARAAELEMFAGRVAHDVLSPLASTHMALRVLSRVEEPKLASAVQGAVASLARARQVVEGLLGFATSGGAPRRGQRTSLPQALASAQVELGPEAEASQVQLVCATPPNCEVACGPEILGIVLSNLIRNSIKFMGACSTRRVEVTALAEDSMVRVEVADTGPGMPAGFETEAFRAYSRGQDDRPGLGLGLATVKRLVDAYGGKVAIRSTPGTGTSVWFTLPRVRPTGSLGHTAVA